jgi:hypothetical protein
MECQPQLFKGGVNLGRVTVQRPLHTALESGLQGSGRRRLARFVITI